MARPLLLLLLAALAGCAGSGARDTVAAAQAPASAAGTLPARLLAYKVRLNPRGPVSGGGEVQLVSDIKVQPGTRAAVVEQETTLYAPNSHGRPVKTVRKVASSTQDAGNYRAVFSLKLPPDAPVGIYPLRAVVYLNGKPMASRTLHLQVAKASL